MFLKSPTFVLLVSFLVVVIIDLSPAAGDEVEIEILTPPPADCKRKTRKFDQLTMHYTGTLTQTGEQFDSSHDRDKPFSFQLGTGQVIKGWDEGLKGMCAGEKRRLKIPSSKGYGQQGAGKIPPHADLTFEAELIKVEDGVPPKNVFKEIDTNKDKLLSQEEVSNYLKEQVESASNEEPSAEQHAEILNQIFTHEDHDKDGFISHEEFSGPKHDEL